jgi:hypothetical protein
MPIFIVALSFRISIHEVIKTFTLEVNARCGARLRCASLHLQPTSDAKARKLQSPIVLTRAVMVGLNKEVRNDAPLSLKKRIV